MPVVNHGMYVMTRTPVPRIAIIGNAATQTSRTRAHLRRRMDAGIHCLAAWEGEHIVADMLKRARAAGSDATVLGLSWAHLQTREARLRREAKT